MSPVSSPKMLSPKDKSISRRRASCSGGIDPAAGAVVSGTEAGNSTDGV